jgi:membrane protein YqaA with SNARE-associated domain
VIGQNHADQRKRSPMFRRLYDWTMSLSASPRAPYALGAVSFAESSFFPIPPDIVLAPMALARPDKAWFYATICTVTSVLGGLLGYAIGALAFATIGQWLISIYGGAEKIQHLLDLYRDYGAWVILIKGLTPIPYKFVTIASGMAGYDLLWFVVLSAMTRGARFFLLAGLFNRFGGPMKVALERYFGPILIGFFVTIIGGFIALRYLL